MRMGNLPVGQFVFLRLKAALAIIASFEAALRGSGARAICVGRNSRFSYVAAATHRTGTREIAQRARAARSHTRPRCTHGALARLVSPGYDGGRTGRDGIFTR